MRRTGSLQQARWQGAKEAGVSNKLRCIGQIADLTFEIEIRIRLNGFNLNGADREQATVRLTIDTVSRYSLINGRRRSHNTRRGWRRQSFALCVIFGLGQPC